jgi:hypothetical protein
MLREIRRSTVLPVALFFMLNVMQSPELFSPDSKRSFTVRNVTGIQTRFNSFIQEVMGWKLRLRSLKQVSGGLSFQNKI